jgi:cytochrome c-type biogenesis protein
VSDLIQAFLLGNASILTNVCLLPLYPGLLAFLAGTSPDERGERPVRHAALLGLAVLAGVLAFMLLLGAVLYALGRGFEAVLPVLLPAAYLAVIALGIVMLLGRNPFAGIATAAMPSPSRPVAAAFVYGALLAPVTLPCTGPVVISAFLLGTGSTGSLAGSVLWFLAFGLGFGWPLVALAVVAAPAQRAFTGWIVANHARLTRIAGVLLVLVGLWGFRTEVLPNLGA